MPKNITEHPDAPDRSALGDFLVEPVPEAEITARRAEGQHLVERNVLEADALDVYAELDPEPFEPGHDDVGTVLYRLVQLFGTPPFPEYRAGEDISHRTDTTFKYLFTVKRGVTDPDDDPEEEWLVTVHDWHVSLGVSLATWRDGNAEETSETAADTEDAENTDGTARTDATDVADDADDAVDVVDPDIDVDRALSSLALVYYVVTDSVQCVFADRWY